jgi:hypothetical protein
VAIFNGASGFTCIGAPSARREIMDSPRHPPRQVFIFLFFTQKGGQCDKM